MISQVCSTRHRCPPIKGTLNPLWWLLITLSQENIIIVPLRISFCSGPCCHAKSLQLGSTIDFFPPLANCIANSFGYSEGYLSRKRLSGHCQLNSSKSCVLCAWCLLQKRPTIIFWKGANGNDNYLYYFENLFSSSDQQLEGQVPTPRLKILLNSLWHLPMSYSAMGSKYSQLFWLL